jgi:hypothetical protein
MKRDGGRFRPPCFRVSLELGCFAATLSVLPYGIGFGPGTGATPQIADGQGGSGDGVRIRELLPWVLAEPPVMHVPVNVLLSG